MDKHSNEFAVWRGRGLSVRAANILVQLRCAELNDVRVLGPDEVMRAHGIGPPTFNEIADLLGWPLVAARERRRRQSATVRADGQLTKAGVATVLKIIHGAGIPQERD